MPTISGVSHQGVRAELRRSYEQQLLAALRASGPLSRADLAARLGVSRNTLGDIVTDLLERAVIVRAPGRSEPARGRPAARLALNPQAGQFLGVDFGHHRVHLAVIDASHAITADGAHPYDPDSPWPARVTAAFDLLDRLAGDRGVDLDAIVGIGIGLPGPFSPRTPPGPLPTTTSVSDYVADAFRGRFAETRLVLDNNTRFAALAEAIRIDVAATRSLVYVRLSDGVGGGLVIDGRLVLGANGYAGELGHVSVRADGRVCRCGKRGCLETVASVPAILERCGELGAPLGSLADLDQAVRRADPIVDRVLRDAGEAVGYVLGTLAVALNPDELVIGGPLVHVAAPLLDQARRAIDWELLPVGDVVPVLRRAELGDEDGAVGAVAALLHSSPLLANYPADARLSTLGEVSTA